MKKSQTVRAPKAPGFRRLMTDLHIWVGLLVAWVLYAMFLTGTVSYFREELSDYMRPELVFRQDFSAARTVERVYAQIKEKRPDTTQVIISLPTERSPFVSALWRDPNGKRRGFAQGTFDAATGTPLVARDTYGGDFFYRFHFNFHYMPVLWGRWLAGFCTMFMLVAIITGVIIHKKIFTDFFTFRSGKGQRSWMDGHIALSVLGLPFHFMITWSGLVMLMFMYMPFGLQALPSSNDRLAVDNELRIFLPASDLKGPPAQLTALAPLIERAEQQWGKAGIGSVRIVDPDSVTARIAVVKSDAAKISKAPRYFLFDGITGELLQAKEVSSPMVNLHGTLYGLHKGRFADIPMRWMYFLIGLTGTAMVGSGLVLWTVKHRQKLPDPERPYFGFFLVERLNIATIAGLSVAMCAFLWLNRLLPVTLHQRADWEVHGFFMVWAATFLWAFLRPAKKAWVELFVVAAALLALLPVLNLFVTDRGLFSAVRHGDQLFMAIDLSLWCLALLHGYIAWRIACHKLRIPKNRSNQVKKPPINADSMLVSEAKEC
ncbi:hypothetical protein AAEX37_00541 [Oligella sp. MSHR50489EDL]